MMTYGKVQSGIAMSVLHLPDGHPERQEFVRLEEALHVRHRRN